MKKIVLSLLIVGLVSSIYAKGTSGIYVGASSVFGIGMKDIDIGKTTAGDDVTLSMGGGVGLGLNIGYEISPTYDIEASFGTQKSTMTKVSNGSGEFTRNFTLFTFKVKKPMPNKAIIKYGGGFGIYSGGKFVLDFDPGVTSYEKREQEYEATSGLHLVLEYEKEINETLSWSVGAKYYNVTYKEKDSIVEDGVTYNNLYTDTADGSGLDVTLSIVKYF